MSYPYSGWRGEGRGGGRQVVRLWSRSEGEQRVPRKKPQTEVTRNSGKNLKRTQGQPNNARPSPPSVDHENCPRSIDGTLLNSRRSLAQLTVRAASKS